MLPLRRHENTDCRTGPRLCNPFIPTSSKPAMGSGDADEFAICVECGNSIEQCGCVCPYCGERDKCECALFDAATGGE